MDPRADESRPTDADRVVGAIVGGAIGDGWGGASEGRGPRGPVAPPRRLVASDDTQLTLATCEAVLEAGRVDPATIAAAFLRWFRAGRLRGVGASTAAALRSLDAGAPWTLSGAVGERAAGNGAAMRVAPLAFGLDPADDGDRRVLRDVVSITHRHDEAFVGAWAVVVAVREAAAGASLDGLLERVAAALPDSAVRDRLRAVDACGRVTPAEAGARFGATGYVVDSVPIALLAARGAEDHPFEAVVASAVAAGGDTDTIASIAGQVAGAALGLRAVPEDLRARLDDREDVEATAAAFAARWPRRGLGRAGGPSSTVRG
ncbi:MAG: ADP-ribosylglycohydrolase family protein [Planctomycetota bacterium]